MKLRLLGLAACAAYAVVALASGLDRMSGTYPGVAHDVPQVFSANAARVLAANALEVKRPDQAIEHSRLAVLHDPVDARSLSLHGQALLALNRGREARRAFEVAGRMGWRDPATQIYWMYAALDARDFRMASERLDAVLRQAPRYPEAAPLLAMLEATPVGRTQLAERLMARPAWAQIYFEDTATIPEVSVYMRGEVARALAAKGFRDCSLTAPALAATVRRIGWPEAHAVWQAHCAGRGAGGLLADSGFAAARVDRQLTPFDWQFVSDGALDISLGEVSGFRDKAVSVSSTAPGRRAFVQQVVVLGPGSYELKWRALDAQGKPSGAVTASVECNPNVHRPLPARLIDARSGTYAAAFPVPGGGCTAQWLGLGIEPGGAPVTVDDVSIARR